MSSGNIHMKSNVQIPILKSDDGNLHTSFSSGNPFLISMNLITDKKKTTGDNCHLPNGVPRNSENPNTSILILIDSCFKLDVNMLVPFSVPGVSVNIVDQKYINVIVEKDIVEKDIIGEISMSKFKDIVNELVGDVDIDELVINKKYHLILLKAIVDTHEDSINKIVWSADQTQLLPNLFLFHIYDIEMLILLFRIGVHNHVGEEGVRLLLKKIIDNQYIEALGWFFDIFCTTNSPQFLINSQYILFSFLNKKIEVFNFLTSSVVFKTMFLRSPLEKLPYDVKTFYKFASKRRNWKKYVSILRFKTILEGKKIVFLFPLPTDAKFTKDFISSNIKIFKKSKKCNKYIYEEYISLLIKIGFPSDKDLYDMYKTFWKKEIDACYTRYKMYYMYILKIPLQHFSKGYRKEAKQLKKQYRQFEENTKKMLDRFLRCTSHNVGKIIFEFLVGTHYNVVFNSFKKLK